MLTNLIKNWFFIFIIFFLFSCQKDSSSQVPYVYVHLNLGVYTDLAYLGVTEIATITRDTTSAGINTSIIDFHNKHPKIRINQRVDGNGLIIYRDAVDHYYVFDLTCTYRAKEDYCALKIDGLIANCPCCKSKFLLSPQDGEFLPANGSLANTPLKQYQATLVTNGTTLFITN